MTNAHFDRIEDYRDVESTNYYQILLDQGKSEDEAIHIIEERSRDNGRTPMQWTDGEHAGFMPEGSTASPWLQIPSVKPEANARAEVKDPDSIYSFYHYLVLIRKAYPLISEGLIRFFDPEDDRVLAYERYFDSDDKRKQSLLVFCNLTGEDIHAEIPRGKDADLMTSKAGGTCQVLVNNYGCSDLSAAGDRKITLRPYEVYALFLK